MARPRVSGREMAAYDFRSDARRMAMLGCFVALGAYRLCSAKCAEPLAWLQCLKFLETPRSVGQCARPRVGSRMPPPPPSRGCISSGCHECRRSATAARARSSAGRLLAMTNAPIPISFRPTPRCTTACLERRTPRGSASACLDFIDTRGAPTAVFPGHWPTITLDAESPSPASRLGHIAFLRRARRAARKIFAGGPEGA